MNDFQYKISFSEQVTDIHSRDLLINQDCVGFFINGCADTQEFEGEIGWYRGKIDPVFIESVKRCIENNPFLSGPEYPTQITRGQPTKGFYFEKGELNRSYVFNSNNPLPNHFVELQEKYYDVIKILKGFPWKTIHVYIDIKSSFIYFGDYLDLLITFQNTGTSKIYFRNPSSSKAGTIEFSLEFAKKNVPAADVSADHFFSINLKMSELLINETDVISSDLQTLQLDPSAELKVSCRCRIPKCSEGEYSINLVFNSVGTEENLDNPEFIDGEVHTAKKTLKIIRKQLT